MEDRTNVEFSVSYHSNALNILLHLNNVLEQKPINLSSYRNIVSTQCDNHMTGVNTSQMTPEEYSIWMISIIFP